jgi:hypothetical protein
MPSLPEPCRAFAARPRGVWAVAGFVLAATTLSLAGCSKPDTVALKRLACEQAGANLDLHSLSQLDALRKALGLARDVDPIGYCRSIGARLELSQPAPDAGSEAAEQSGQSE